MPVPLTARAPVDFYPPAKPDILIRINVPTPYERDAFASMLVRGGVVHYSQAQIRDLMLAGVSAIFGPEKFDELRAATELAWAASDALDEARADRLAKQIELREKAIEGNAGLPLTQLQQVTLEASIIAALEGIKPSVDISEDQRIAVAVMQQEVITRFEPLRQAFANLAEQKTRRDWLTIETYVTGWSGLVFEPEGNGRGGLQRHEAEYLRRKVGDVAFEQIGDFIFALHSLDEDEEKNLASLLESMSAQVGSTATSSTPSSDTGSSTEPTPLDAPSPTDTGETPDIASATTTAPSSISTPAVAKKTGRSKHSPTAVR